MNRHHCPPVFALNQKKTTLILRLKTIPAILHLLLLGAPGAALLSLPQAAQAQAAGSGTAETAFSIPPGALDDALVRFGQAAQTTIVADPALTAGKRSNGLQGRHGVHSGLQRLLAGTGLQAMPDASGGYTLRKLPAPPPEQSAAAPKILSSVVVSGARTKDEIGHDNVYDKNISNLYTDRQYMERYQGVSVGDVFAGMNGVYNADNRHGSALFPNIRGLSGNGRIPVTVDGTQQSLDVWMALRGVNNRNYVDPNLFRSVEVEKGPSMTRGIKSGVGGSVNIRTIEAADIIAPDKTWGLEFKTSTASNSVKDGYDPFSAIGKDYRDLPGAIAANPWADPGVSFLKPQMEMRKRGDESRFNGDDRKVFISGAYKHEFFDAMLAYSDARRGNYFAGKKGADKYDQTVRPGAASGANLYPYLAKIYAPGYEVPFTNTASESILAKNNWYLPNDQKVSFSYSHNRLNFAEMPAFHSEIYNMAVEIDPSLQLARSQFMYPSPNSLVDQKTYRMGYEFKPEGSRWMDLEMSLWRTINKSTRYQNGDVTYHIGAKDMMWDVYTQCKYQSDADTNAMCEMLNAIGMYDPDNPPAKDPDPEGKYKVYVGNRQDSHAVRTGFDISNRFKLSDTLALTLAGDWQYEHNKERMGQENTSVMGMGLSNVAFGPASGRREEYGGTLNMDWKATQKLQISAGVRYSSFWGHDDETDRRRDERHNLWGSNKVNTHKIITYKQLKSDEEYAREAAITQANATWLASSDPAARDEWLRLSDEYEAYRRASGYQGGANQDHEDGLVYWMVGTPVELRDGKADRNQNPFYNGKANVDETINAQGGTYKKYKDIGQGNNYLSYIPADRWKHTERRRSHAWSAQLLASYLLTDRARVYGRLSSMARFPSIMEFSNRNTMYGEFPYALKPERNQAWEVGLAYNLAGLLEGVPVADVKLSYFHNTISDYYDRTSQMNVIQFDRKIMSGLELQSRFDTGRFYGGLGGTLRLRQDMCDADYAVQLDPVLQRWDKCMPGGFVDTMSFYSLQPKYSINLDLGTRLLQRKLDLGMRMRYHSSTSNKKIERMDSRFLAGFTMPYFWRPVKLFDAYAEYNFDRHSSLRLSVENLTDAYYLDPMTKVPMPGPSRTIRLDLSLRF